MKIMLKWIGESLKIIYNTITEDIPTKKETKRT